MAVYCTQTDLELAAGGAASLVQLADWDADGAVDAAVIDSVIARAQSLVDSYVRRAGHKVPLADPVPTEVKHRTAEIAVFLLRKSRNMYSDGDVADHELTLKELEKIAKGELNLNVDPAPEKSSARIDAARDRSAGKAMSRFKLKGVIW